MRVLVYGMVGTHRGGIETFLLKMNQHMNADVVFDYVIEENTCMHEEEIKARGGKIYYIAARKANPTKNMLDNYRLLKSLKNEVDAVYFNLSSLSWIIPIEMAIKQGYRVYIHSHNAEFIAANSGKFYRLVNAISKKRVGTLPVTRLTCSKPATEFMFGKPDNVTMIYNAINPEKFAFHSEIREKIRQEKSIDDDEFVIGFVGRLQYQKNPLYLAEIMKAITPDRENLKMLVIGQGNMEQELREKICEYGLEEKILLLGNCTNVNELLQAMDVFVLPSHHEGLPYVVVEAQTSGLKCLVSEAVTREVNITGNVEFLPLTADAENWKNAIVEIMDKPNANREQWAIFIGDTNFNIRNEAVRLEGILSGTI